MSQANDFLDGKVQPSEIDGFLGPEPVKPAGALRRLGDLGVSAARGIVGVPEAAVGMADLVTGGYAGKLVERAGVRFKDAKDIIGEYYSPEQKAASEAVNSAKGFMPTVAAMVENPSTILNAAVESAPSMIAGGAVSRGALAGGALARVAGKEAAPIIAGAIGEGATAAGQNAEQVRQESADGLLTAKQSAILAASGVLTGGIGYGAGRVANKLGIGDAQTMLATGKLGAVGEEAIAAGANKGVIRKIGEGFLNEGVLQELPQSYQEQVAQNLAQGKPWDEGAASAGAQGMLAGALMGGVAGGLHGKDAAPVADTPVPAPEDPAAGPTLQLGNTPDPLIGFPDGTVARRSEADAYVNSLPADQQPAARAKLMGLEPQPVVQEQTPSQSMGLDPTAGPLSAAAVTAVDTGAHQSGLDTQAAQSQEQDYAQASAADQARYDMQLDEQNTSNKAITSGAYAEAQMTPEDRHAVLFSNQSVADGGRRYEGTQDGDVLNGMGAPFSTPLAARRRAQMEGKDWTIAPVFDGYVARRKDSMPEKSGNTPIAPVQSAQIAINNVANETLNQGETTNVPQADQAIQAEAKQQTQGAAATAGVADAEPVTPVTQPAQPVTGEGAGASQPTQVAATKPGPASLGSVKSDMDHLFGVDQKRAKALTRIADGKAWFGNEIKAKQFVTQNGLKDTHEVKMTKPGRFDVAAKASTSKQAPAQTNTAPAATETVAKDQNEADWTRMRDVDRRALAKKAGLNALQVGKAALQSWENMGSVFKSKIEKAMNEPLASATNENAKPAETPAQSVLNSWLDLTYTQSLNEMDAATHDVDIGFLKALHDQMRNVEAKGLENVDRKKRRIGYLLSAIQAKETGKGGIGPKPVSGMQTANVEQSPAELAAALRQKLRDQEATGGPVDDRLAQQVASLDKANAAAPVSNTQAEPAKPYRPSKEASSAWNAALERYALRNYHESGPEQRAAFGEGYMRAFDGVGSNPSAKHIAAHVDGVLFYERIAKDAPSAAAPAKGLGEQLAKLNAELERQGPVQNANTRAQRDSIRKQIAAEDFPEVLKAVDDNIDVAEELNSAFKFAGDEPKAKTIARILKKRGITPEYQARWTERLIDGQNDELDAEMQSYEAKPNPTYSGQPKTEPKAPEAQTKSAPAATETVAVKANTVFTEDAAAAARARLKAKLSRLNTGVDPEMLMDGIILSGYHIEKGARTFVAYARAMIDDLGDGVKPYLKSWYMASKYDPRMAGMDGLDDAATMDAVNLDKLETPEPAKSGKEGRGTLTAALTAEILSGKMPKDNPALKKLVEAFDGKPADQNRMKEAQEALESAIVNVSRAVVAKNEGPRSTFDSLLRLYESQPNLNIRTSTSIANQAYSTPAPLAYLGSVLADVTAKTTMYEPTAGNGMLTINALPGNVTVNELEANRIDSLKSQGFKQVLEGDAVKADVPAKSQDRVVTNPPFGSIKDSKGEATKISVDGYKIGQIDHLIAARALETMRDDGKATLIIGANKVSGGLNTDDRIFFNWLYGNYNVTSHFEVDGDLYQRQGAGWPVRVITISGRVKSDRVSPVAGTIQRAQNWEQVYEQFTASLDSSRAEPKQGAVTSAGGTSTGQAGAQPVRGSTVKPDSKDGGRGQAGSPVSTGNVSGASAGNGADSSKPAADKLGTRDSGQRLNAEPVESDRLDPAGDAVIAAPAKPAGNPRATALSSAENQFQVTYEPRSARKDGGVLIPVNMKDPTQDALSRLEDAVGDIDAYAAKELGYKSVKQLHEALMGLQVDSVASAIHQIEQGKGVVIADQTGIGKGRQAAAVIRWAERSGYIPVFVSVKPSLFTDMFGDLHDIGSDNIAPFILNKDESIKGPGDTKLFANKALTHKRNIENIRDTGKLPDGSNAIFMTYSQINTDNVQRQMLTALADRAVFILDESHNAGGQSNTGEFMISLLEGAKGVTYLSATYAKRPDNMPLYFKTDIGQAAADNEGLMQAMASGGLPLQTVVSNNLVKAGQMFRRERSYDGVSIETIVDTEHRTEHEKLSDETTRALRAIVSADRMFHHVFVKQMNEDAKSQGAAVIDNAGNQAQAGVDHTQFSSVVHNFVKQMLLGLKAQRAADEAIAALKDNRKPIIAVENTMGSFLEAYAKDNMVTQGGSLGSFDYRTVLSRALARTLFITEVTPTGDKVKREIKLSELDAETRAAYDNAQQVIDGLKLDIPVSPIDWIRNEIRKAGFTVAEITGRKLAVDYSEPGKATLGSIDALEQTDKVRTTQLFNSGRLDALILNVAGSTGISLHASEKFTDQRQRHMIVAQAAGDINIFMQMLGRIHRTGQVVLPGYGILSVDLPTEKRPTAVLSGKMKSLNANTSSNTDSATSIKTVDMFNKYGDQVVAQYLRDNYQLARDLGVEDIIGGDDATEDLAQKATGRLALQPIAVQNSFYDEVEGQYSAMMEYLNKTNQNDLEPRTFDFDAQETRSEVLFDGPNKETPFGEDAVYGEYSIKAQGKAMTPAEIREAINTNLDGKKPDQHMQAALAPLVKQFDDYIKTLEGPSRDSANAARAAGQAFMVNHSIGDTFRVDINGDSFNAVVTNIRNTHKANGNPFSLSKIQVTIALNGALRSISVPASQFQKIEVSSIGRGYTVEQLFKEQPANQRETAKIVTGNLLAAYGELQGVRGTIITFTKQDGTTEQGILLPKAFDYSRNTRGDYRLATGADALNFLQKSENKDIGRFGIQSRDGIVRVLPAGQGITVLVPKSKLKGGKFFLDKGLIDVLGDFVTSGSSMRAITYDKGNAIKALDLLMKKGALYALPSMAEEAKAMAGETPAASRVKFSRGAQGQATGAVESKVAELTANWENKPNIVVAFDMQDERIPERVRMEDQKQRSGGATGTPEGFYYKGTVYLMSSKLATDKDIARVLYHEALGHYGLRSVYGKSLKIVLSKIATFRKAEVAAKMEQYGLKGINSLDRMTAAEEVLAEMAQDTPSIGLVREAVAAVRTWLRENVPGFKNLNMTDDEIIRSYILPARNFVERGTRPSTSAATPAFSRTVNGAPVFSRSAVLQQVGDKLNETLNHPGTVSKWHTTVGSMYNLAERSPAFKRVFDAAQGFLNDVSYYATEAADMSPKILPKLENWRDIGKSPISYADNKAISAPIFEGTLGWARDEQGKPIRIEDMAKAAEALSTDQKSQRLLRGDKISEGVLKMWRGLPIEQYESMIEGSYEKNMLRPGVVWTDKELASMFKLNPAQIGLYQEFRKGIDTSIDNAAKAGMLRTAGKDAADMAQMVMDSPDVDAAGILLRDHFLQMADENPERRTALIESANGMMDQADKASKLKAEGYAPLSRFGQYSVDVVVNGERQEFRMFEDKRSSNQFAAQMRGKYGPASVSQSTMSQKEFEQFQGIAPETMELFGNMLGLDSTGNEASDQVFQKYLKMTKANRSAMKRLIHRKGTAGYSEDVGRVLAAFITSNARHTAGALNLGELGDSVNDIPKGQGELKDVAIKLQKYVTQPEEEAQAIRGLIFAQYLGGSVASAMVNLTQPMTVSFPYLSQFGGAKQSGAQLVQAYKDMANKAFKYEPGLAKALHTAEEQGVVSPQEVHQLQAQARGTATLHGGDGTKMGDAMAKGQNALAKLSMGWGKLFGIAEQINRRSTFIAAYRIGIAQKVDDPAAFASKAVNETQFINNRGNKMQWGRGAVGATLMTFKSYSFNWLELFHRMATQSGPEGKKAAALMVAMLFLSAGAGGLPFADDLDDLLDFIGQKLGYNLSSNKAKQQFLEDVFGKAGAQFVDRGLTGLPGSPIDVSGRMSMGNLIPATGLLLDKRDSSRDVQELLGPIGDMAKRAGQSAGALVDGDFKRALLAAAPRAITNLAQGADMADKGYYADAKGYKVLDTSPAEAAFKAIGFQPQSVSNVQESNGITQRMKEGYSLRAQDIRSRWAKGIFEKDADQVQTARDMLKDWNDKNPDQRMIVDLPSVWKKVREMAKPKDQRIAETAPKAMRVQLKRELLESRG